MWGNAVGLCGFLRGGWVGIFYFYSCKTPKSILKVAFKGHFTKYLANSGKKC